ncbi:pyruvate dehydrogenase E2 component (dihydrolipoamide acetyltransferase) [Pseudomonas jinjuensis]|uniref:Dihydrolipoamide acetyltransferase component of pyruvate dehydrogenase complex n=2 Tax=Pseudomonas jinjuensis TaxID=198616 RepID=A0A1G9ZZ63_9PSED|nr:pyruvate dehydrogenase E2 component (dihydrolipoamide acetyltransferase) [Pseudomonas jinjuensis]
MPATDPEAKETAMKYFKLPDLGEGLQEAEISQWHVKAGERVKADQPLVSVETAKALVEIPAPHDGVVVKLFGAEGDVLHVGEPLVAYEGEETDAGTVVGRLEGGGENAQVDQFFVGAAPSTREHLAPRATPAVRQLARQLGVELAGLSGSGAAGLITRADVEAAAQSARDSFGGERLRGVRRSMAINMARSHAEVVPVTIHGDADLQRWGAARDPLIRLAQAIAVACREEPLLNSWFDGASLSLRQHPQVDLGIAVDTPDGLFVPVLRNVGERSAEDLRAGIARLRADVQSRSIPPQEMLGATITLSNFGTLFGRYASPVVVPPQVAIIGAGGIRDEPVAWEGQVAIHPRLPLSLSFDHRAVTGGEAARFLKVLVQALEEPD